MAAWRPVSSHAAVAGPLLQYPPAGCGAPHPLRAKPIPLRGDLMLGLETRGGAGLLAIGAAHFLARPSDIRQVMSMLDRYLC